MTAQPKTENVNDACVRCGGALYQHGIFPNVLKVAGTEFSIDTEADRCITCGDLIIRPWTLELIWQQIALYFARTGATSPDAFRFMRRQAGLNSAALADLLGVRPETISRLENGKTAIDRRTVAVVAAIVEDRARGSTVTKDRLTAMSGARKRAKSVVLERIGTYEEQLQKLPPGRMREMLKRTLADYKSGRVERSFRSLLEVEMKAAGRRR
ncbi:MAG TPA: helix-turn-helix domain-containing protein [Myxococcales bacterium]|jgi:transcriptional regulator with XRE-family HTH domain